MSTKIDWGAWANEAFATTMSILRKQIGGDSTYMGSGSKNVYNATPGVAPSEKTSFLSKFNLKNIVIIIAGLAIALLIFQRIK